MKIKQRLKNCKNCSLCLTRNRIVFGDWNKKAKFFFIGLAPGRLGADQTGIPFTKDKSGKFFRNLLKKSKIMNNEINVTNVVRCNPRNKKGNNRPPTKQEISSCIKYLHKEIEYANPEIIIPLGKIPTETILNIKIKSFREYHGKCFNINKKIIIPLYHPSYIINYNGYNKEKYAKDFMKLKTIE